MSIKIAVVGATGMVGRTFLKVLTEYNIENAQYTLFSSAKSAGSVIDFLGSSYTVKELTENSFDEGFDYALFSAGGSTSAKYAPIAAKKGCVVIDNSSHWRMDPDVPLVVPQVNPEAAFNHKGIIANPNCSTIQAMLPLSILHQEYGIKRVVYSTYQAVSGAGVSGLDDLVKGREAAVNGNDFTPCKFPYPIIDNCIPHIDVFLDNGYTKEEQKMIDETRKILEDNEIAITATCVRVPVSNGHSESINVELIKPYEIDDVVKLMQGVPGLIVSDNIAENIYPLATTADDRNEVFVGRIRRDESAPNALNMWVVADNIRKGAATNAVEIAVLLINGK